MLSPWLFGICIEWQEGSLAISQLLFENDIVLVADSDGLVYRLVNAFSNECEKN